MINSGDLLYIILPIANIMVLCTSKFVRRVNLMLSVLTTKGEKKIKTKGHKKTFRDVGYVYYFDCSDGTMDVCIYPNSSDRIP